MGSITRHVWRQFGLAVAGVDQGVDVGSVEGAVEGEGVEDEEAAGSVESVLAMILAHFRVVEQGRGDWHQILDVASLPLQITLGWVYN